MSGFLPRTKKQTDTDEKKQKVSLKEFGRNAAAAAAHTGCDPAAQTDAERPRSAKPTEYLGTSV